MKIEVFASQTHVTEKDIRGKDCVVIDTLRATSTIITALANGCEQVIPVEEVPGCALRSAGIRWPFWAVNAADKRFLVLI